MGEASQQLRKSLPSHWLNNLSRPAQIHNNTHLSSRPDLLRKHTVEKFQTSATSVMLGFILSKYLKYNSCLFFPVLWFTFVMNWPFKRPYSATFKAVLKASRRYGPVFYIGFPYSTRCHFQQKKKSEKFPLYEVFATGDRGNLGRWPFRQNENAMNSIFAYTI